jgi:hypothetical protein
MIADDHIHMREECRAKAPARPALRLPELHYQLAAKGATDPVASSMMQIPASGKSTMLMVGTS